MLKLLSIVALGCLGLAFALWLQGESGSEFDGLESGRESARRDEEAGSSRDLIPKVVHGDRETLTGAVSSVSGMVVDRATGEPIAARILRNGEVFSVSGLDGHFRLQVDLSGKFEFLAPGYQPLSHKFIGGASVVVPLVALAECRLTFVSSGSPVPGVLAWMGESSESLDKNAGAPTLVSSSQGLMVVKVAEDSYLQYVGPSGERGSVEIAPYSEFEIQLGVARRVLTLRDVNGKILDPVGVQVSHGALGSNRVVESSVHEGEILIPGYSGAMQLQFSRKSLVIERAVEEDVVLNVQRPNRRVWSIVTRTSTKDLVLYCAPTVEISVQDAASGSPVTADCSWGRESKGSTPTSWRGFNRNQARGEAIDGVLELPVKGLLPVGEGERVVIWFEGYAPWSTHAPDELLAGTPILLHRATEKTLRLSQLSGAPFLGKVRVQDIHHELYLLNGQGNKELDADKRGEITDIYWSGGDWAIKQLDGKLMTIVSADALSESGTVEVTLPLNTGGVLFVGVPKLVGVPVASLVHMVRSNWRGKLHHARPLKADGEWLVEGLLPGEYLVGPSAIAEWYPTPNPYSSARQPSTRVEAEEIVTVRWKDEWTIKETITGRIQVRNGDLNAVRAFGLFGGGGERRMTGAIRYQIPIDLTGNYALRSGQPLPGAILIGVELPRDSRGFGGFVPLEVIQPGEDAVLDATPLVLQCGEGAIGKEGVSVHVPIDSMLQRLVVDSESVIYWPPGSELQIPFLGGRVEQIRLRVGSNISAEIQLHAGESGLGGFHIEKTLFPTAK